MSKAKESRFSKATVLEEVRVLRTHIGDYCVMGMEDLQAEHDLVYPAQKGQKQDIKQLLHNLIMSKTYRMTNILNIE